VLLTCDEAADVAQCLLSVADAQDATATDAEFVVVDDASTDGTRDLVAGLEGEVTVVLNHHRVGAAACLQRAVACATGDHVLVLPPTARVEAGWLDEVARSFSDVPVPRRAAVWLLDRHGALVQRAEAGVPVT